MDSVDFVKSERLRKCLCSVFPVDDFDEIVCPLICTIIKSDVCNQTYIGGIERGLALAARAGNRNIYWCLHGQTYYFFFHMSEEKLLEELSTFGALKDEV